MAPEVDSSTSCGSSSFSVRGCGAATAQHELKREHELK